MNGQNANSNGGGTSSAVRVEHTGSKEKLESDVDAELLSFDSWVGAVLGQPMIRAERAMVKTYLMWRLNPSVPGGRAADPSPPAS